MPFELAGGHADNFQIDDTWVLKNGGVREAAFYKASESTNHPFIKGLTKWMPKHFDVDVERGFIKMENLLTGFNVASLLDIKMGVKIWDDDAAPEKIDKMMNKIIGSTSESHGIRITSFISKHPNNNSPDVTLPRADAPYISRIANHFGFSSDLPADSIICLALLKFLDPAGDVDRGELQKALNYLISIIDELILLWNLNDRFMVRGSSIFFFFDQTKGLSSLQVKLIDFAHINVCDSPCDNFDENYKIGLDNLRKILISAKNFM